jgi:hypothetical protein
MIKDPEVAETVANSLKESYRLLDESAFKVRQNCSESEAHEYVQAVGRVCAEIIFGLMEPLYQAHPNLAPEGWDSPPEEILKKNAPPQ